jgi:hypothetical protein
MALNTVFLPLCPATNMTYLIIRKIIDFSALLVHNNRPPFDTYCLLLLANDGQTQFKKSFTTTFYYVVDEKEENDFGGKPTTVLRAVKDFFVADKHD